MDSNEILKALERERALLEDFICLSEEQLLLLEDEDIDAVNSLHLSLSPPERSQPRSASPIGRSRNRSRG